jgi:hypothetical protein
MGEGSEMQEDMEVGSEEEAGMGSEIKRVEEVAVVRGRGEG